MIVCEPEFVEENVYIAVPFKSTSEELTVVSSTVSDRVPVGIVFTELDSEPTVMLMTSLAPDAGMVVAAEIVITEDVGDVVVVLGHAFNKLSKLIEPSPVASS